MAGRHANLRSSFHFLFLLFNVSKLLILQSNDICPEPGPSSHGSISCFYQNVRSLKAFALNDDGSKECKLSMLKDVVYGSDIDLVAVTETWLNPTVLDIEILPQG